MGVSRVAILLGAMLMLGLAAGLDVSGNPILVPITDIGMRIAHETIEIGSNAGFTEENGVVRGAGTVASPYVIENWTITVQSSGEGVFIHDTDAYFVVRNVEVKYVDDDGIGYSDVVGIRIERCSNGRVEWNIIYATEVGIQVHESDRIRVSRNEVRGTLESFSSGIHTESCENVDLIENELEMWGYAVFALRSNDGRIDENTIRNTRIGINLADCRGMIVGVNEIYSTSTEYSDNSWSDNTWLLSESTTKGDFGLVVLFGVVVPADAVLLILGFVRLRRVSGET